jgi:serine/threonine protein phosphatase PrpC
MSDDTPRPRGPRDAGLSDSPTGPLRAQGIFSIEAAGRTDKGRVRTGNEDAFGLEPPTSSQARAHGTLLVVSDGMGGHAAGEVASNLAVETILATYYREHGASTSEAIRNAITTANSAIFTSAERDAARAGMGCTVVVMVVQGSSLTVGHVGDSRGYLIRGGRARQLTRDHSWVAMQVEEGILTPEQAEHHPNRSLLMRALGRQPSVEVEIGQHQLQAGDVLVICSDGLTSVVNEAEIGEYASRYAPAAAADQLVDLANQRGAPDNVTVVAAVITATTGALVDGNSTTMTMAAPAADALTARIVQPPDEATTPTLRDAAAASAPPIGTPVVLSRESGPPRAAGPGRGRRGRGRWLAGSLAAFGLAAGLVLLTLLGPRPVGDPEPSGVAEGPAANKPAATPAAAGQAPPVATVPPPVATGIPGLVSPGGAISAAPPPPAAATPLLPVATPTSATASKPAEPVQPGAIPGVIASILPVPTLPSGSPPALTVPTSVPTATPTPAASGAGSAPSAGAPGSSDSAAGANDPSPDGAGSADAAPPTDAVAPADAAASAEEEGAEQNPDDGAPAIADEPDAGSPAAEEPPAAPPPAASQPPPAPRFTPPPGVVIPGGLPFRPGRKPSDD